MNFFKNILFRTTFFILASAILSAFAFAQENANELIPFELEGLDEKTYTDSDFSNTALIILLADGPASKYNYRYVWSQPINEFIADKNLEGKVQFLRALDLAEIPRLMRGTMKKQILSRRDLYRNIALLDWEGKFSEAYQLNKNILHVLIFDSTQKLTYHSELKEFNEGSLGEIREKLEGLQ